MANTPVSNKRGADSIPVGGPGVIYAENNPIACASITSVD